MPREFWLFYAGVVVATIASLLLPGFSGPGVLLGLAVSLPLCAWFWPWCYERRRRR